jgi:hypothetical protein
VALSHPLAFKQTSNCSVFRDLPIGNFNPFLSASTVLKSSGDANKKFDSNHLP